MNALNKSIKHSSPYVIRPEAQELDIQDHLGFVLSKDSLSHVLPTRTLLAHPRRTAVPCLAQLLTPLRDFQRMPFSGASGVHVSRGSCRDDRKRAALPPRPLPPAQGCLWHRACFCCLHGSPFLCDFTVFSTPSISGSPGSSLATRMLRQSSGCLDQPGCTWGLEAALEQALRGSADAHAAEGLVYISLLSVIKYC